MPHRAPKSLLFGLAALAASSFASGLLLERCCLSYLEDHPFLVNLLSSLTSFAAGVLWIALVFNRLAKRDEFRRMEADLMALLRHEDNLALRLMLLLPNSWLTSEHRTELDEMHLARLIGEPPVRTFGSPVKLLITIARHLAAQKFWERNAVVKEANNLIDSDRWSSISDLVGELGQCAERVLDVFEVQASRGLGRFGLREAPKRDSEAARAYESIIDLGRLLEDSVASSEVRSFARARRIESDLPALIKPQREPKLGLARREPLSAKSSARFQMRWRKRPLP